MKRWVWWAGLLISVLVVVTVAAAFVISQRVPTDDPKVQNATTGTLTTFPNLAGTNLLFDEVHVPADLGTGLKLIVTAYAIEQREVVYDWLNPFDQLSEEFPHLSGYFVPLLPKSMADRALFIIGSISLVVNERDRTRTIIVFTDVEGFNELVDVNGKEMIQLFLVDGENRIVWRESGDFKPEKLEALRVILDALVE